MSWLCEDGRERLNMKRRILRVGVPGLVVRRSRTCVV